MTNNSKVENYSRYISFVRQKIHSFAELAWQEKNTLEFLTAQAKNFNCQLLCDDYCLGLFFDFGKQKTVVLRAELDALPILEKTALSFGATNGNMHACGHDGHVAIGMGLAKYLSDHVESGLDVGFNVNVMVLFQPAEEGVGGAEYLLQREFLKGVAFDCGFALHLFPDGEKEKIYTRAGRMLAGTKEGKITFFGKNKHVASKDKSGDALRGIAEFLARGEWDGKNGFLRFCKAQGGVATNVYCQQATAWGSMRFFEEEQVARLNMQVKNQAEKICKKYALKYEWQLCEGIPPVATDKNILKKLKKNRKIFDCGRLFIGDDFGLFASKMPIGYFLLGSGGKHGLHSEFFDFDESLLVTGLDFCLDLLKSR